MVQTGDNMMALKRGNRAAVLLALQREGGMSRKRLSAEVRLTPAAITKIVAELIDEGLVREGASVPGAGAGRREVRIHLVPDARYALGLLIDRRQAILSAADLSGKRMFAETVPLPEAAPAEETVRALSRRLTALAQRLPREICVGVGVAVRGRTDETGRRSQNSMGALSEGDHPIAQWVGEETGLPVRMMNNVRALLAAELFLTREPYGRTQYFLRCEYGIGAAIASAGEIQTGSSNRCSELGHIPVVRGGKLCTCGKRGCLETVASPTALCEDARALLSPDETPLLWKLAGGGRAEHVPLEAVLQAAAQRDTAVTALTERSLEYMAQALRAVSYILDPEKIILYGRIFENEYYLSRLIAMMRDGVEADRTIRIEKSPFNGQLEPVAAPLVAVTEYLRAGGMA